MWADDDKVDYDPVVIHLTFSDETWATAPPMPRYVAEMACRDFGAGVPWINNKRVVVALIAPWVKANA